MLDHIAIGVADMAASLTFYDLAFKPLQVKRLLAYGGTADLPEHVGYGNDQKPYFWIGKNMPINGYVHVALAAQSRALVDAFYEEALAAGGRDNGLPGLRPEYHSGYYGAYIIDLNGCNIEAVHHTF